MDEITQGCLVCEEDLLPGGKVGIDYDTRELLFADRGFCSLVGYEPEELGKSVGAWHELFLTEDDKKVLVSTLSTAVDNGKAQAQARLVRKNGDIIWADVYAGLIENGKEEKYIALMFIDNTEKHIDIQKAENMRREMDVLIANLPGGVANVTVTQDLNILFASDGFYKLSGYTRDEFHAHPIYGRGGLLIVEQDLQRVLQTINDQMQRGDQLFAEYRIRRKDGEIVWLESHGSTVDIVDDIPIAQVIFTDTTASKSGTRKLINLTNSIPGGVAHLKLTEDRLSVEYASDGFYELIGYSKDMFKMLGLRDNCANLFTQADWDTILTDIKTFFANGDEGCELECKIHSSDGNVRWLNLRGRADEEGVRLQELECVVTDVTEMRHSREALRESEMRYRFVSEQMNEIVFEWNIKSGSVLHSSMFKKRFGYTLPEEDTINYLKQRDIIHEDDVQRFAELVEGIESGEEKGEIEIRVRDASGRYLWCGVKISCICDDDGIPYKALGIIFDMEKFKQKIAQLAEQASRDPLTSVFNKTTTRDNINDRLLTRQTDSALFVIDVDYFKAVNDNFGHTMGDEVLITLTKRIKALVRSSDIIGRIGGDEFVVFVAQGMSLRAAQDRADTFIKAMKEPILHKGMSCKVSISVGYVLRSETVFSYDMFFDCADKALYKAKENGRNRAECFK